ncbi:ribokinase [Aliiglaciecola sp. CAU 1673]|uniref:ribokinase n=1 Tax=Aliiglaciecola sp. CAU 1673 TaxID=3032595 RepID=UPI0023DCA609|nr:ribokinase [Aliiglaciecola sp. CAU 1673]MDF2180100.1 ribokinase [Aliiglaciecola sp. CAU 1673]
MAIYNLGSINWDHCYSVPHFVRPGETLSSRDYQRFLGGKGANQSVAAVRAGAWVHHIGAVAEDDVQVRSLIAEYQVAPDGLMLIPGQATGHAIIQINAEGENAIILFPGCNRLLTMEWIEQQFGEANSHDWLLLQNETNLVQESATVAKARGMQVAFNPAPMDKDLTLDMLDYLDLLIVNEVELSDLAGVDDPERALAMLKQKAPNLSLLITLGAKGARYEDQKTSARVDAFKVDAVDTTAAGDTFIGYFLASRAAALSVEESMTRAAAASAICVTRQGAIPSIPTLLEVEAFIKNRKNA